MASLRAPMPSDVLFSTDNVGGEQKIKKVFTTSDVLFSTEKYRWRANEKKLVSRSGLSSKRCNAPLLGSQCATYGACATGWPPLAYIDTSRGQRKSVDIGEVSIQPNSTNLFLNSDFSLM